MIFSKRNPDERERGFIQVRAIFSHNNDDDNDIVLSFAHTAESLFGIPTICYISNMFERRIVCMNYSTKKKKKKKNPKYTYRKKIVFIFIRITFPKIFISKN